MPRLAMLLVAAALVAGCAPIIKFEADGFHQNKNKYSVRFSDPREQLFVSKDWDIDNFVCSRYSDAQPCKFEHKRGAAYYGRIMSDRNNDGTLESSAGYFSDLVLRHRINDGRLWTSTRDLPEKHINNTLDVFLDNYVQSLSGTARVLAGDALGYYSVETRKYATMVTEQQLCGFGPYEAIIATVTIADLDQLRLDENQRVGRLRLMIVKVDGLIDHWIPTKRNQWDVTKEGMTPGKVVMMVGYYNTIPYYETGLKDYYEFLKLFSFDGGKDRLDMQRCIDLYKPEAPKPAPPAEPAAVLKKSPAGTRETKPRPTPPPPKASAPSAAPSSAPTRVELPDE